MIFQVDNLHKSFGEKKVLEGISFSVESGKAFGLLGRNGAGKTTTMRIIMDVFKPDKGVVLINGKPIDRKNMNIGYLPEEHGLYPKEKIVDQIVYLAKLRGMKTQNAKDSIKYWLDRLEMAEYMNRKLDTLSKGNQQKIQLVAALVSKPDFVILDEPFSGLDPVNASVLKDIVKELIKNGKIVLFSSHQMNYVEEFCDNIAILDKGKIVLSGSIQDIKYSYDRSKILIKSKNIQEIQIYCQTALTDIVEKAGIKNDVLKVKLVSEDKKHLLLEKLAESNFDIDSISVFEPSLNDIFVEYTGNNGEKEAGAQ